MVLLQPDPFLNELTSMYERSTEQGSVWVTLKRSSLKSKVQRNKLKTAGDPIEYRCLIRATDGKKTISTSFALLEGSSVDDDLENMWNRGEEDETYDPSFWKFLFLIFYRIVVNFFLFSSPQVFIYYLTDDNYYWLGYMLAETRSFRDTKETATHFPKIFVSHQGINEAI